MKYHNYKTGILFSILFALFLFTECSNTVNVYDYYILNNLANHENGRISNSKVKMLYRKKELSNKAQLELIAFKTDSMKYLVIGSHKLAKAFYLQDSIYYFDVNEIYSNVRGNDFIRQLGDLSIYFTNIPMQNCNKFLSSVERLKAEFNRISFTDGARNHVDYTFQSDVFISIEKRSSSQEAESATTTIWVGKRKHTIDLEDLIKAIQDLKSFN